MREIKFRAWDKAEKEMKLPTLLRLGRDLPFTDDNNNGKVYQCQCNGNENIEYFGLNSSESQLILMQYTGLKDKNGKEIYEGDIVKFTLPEWTVGSGYRDFEGDEVDETVDERTIICEVQIRATRGVGMVYRKDVSDEITDTNLKYHWFKIHPKTDEIIGNIYENPELIKE